MPEQRLERLELYFFDDDPLQELDSYRHAEADGTVLEILSRGGGKLAVALANVAPPDALPRSWFALQSRMQRIEAEDPARPAMSGSALFQAGEDSGLSLRLRPLLGRITLRSIRCDFSGKPYAGARLEKVRAYLINVSDEISLIDEEPQPHSWAHQGALSEEALRRMAHPELICAPLPDLGPQTLYPSLSLYAYPNAPAVEGLGQPATRLVIEGILQGHICYYPVNVPVRRDTELILDLEITRFGTSDPDTPAGSEMIRVRAEREGFKDNGIRTIYY